MNVRPCARAFALLACLATCLAAADAGAQTMGLWDPHHHAEKPDLNGAQVLRFLTEDDYPPFDFLAPDGSLTGFNVDIARALCDALKVSCTIQARRWDTIVDAIENGEGDAAAASLADTPENRKALDFTEPYYRTPARFAVLKNAKLPPPLPENLIGRTIGVQAHTAHEAYLRAFFAKSDIRVYETEASLLSALKRNEVQYAFGDGISLASWLNGSDSNQCCVFVGGPFAESRYFGDGVGVAVRKGNEPLRAALNWAIADIGLNGRYGELYLKWFPISFY